MHLAHLPQRLAATVRRAFTPRPVWPRVLPAVCATHRYQIMCRSPLEVWRANTFAAKEPGTIAWLKAVLRPGEVFCDIGANIGLYSLLAAELVGPAGRVVAVEPHLGNAAGLLENLTANGFADRCIVLSVALHDADGFADFEYRSFQPGESFNQLATGDRPSDCPSGQPAGVERKYAVRLDRLVSDGVMPAADHVKIDVDGNELSILRGMASLLGGAHPPVSVQVEVDPTAATNVRELMARFRYPSVERHFTENGAKAIAAGTSPDAVSHNLIFRREATAEGHS